MTDEPETHAIEELATQAVAPIEQELRRRLSLELDDSAVLAIETALLKSFVGGMRAAAEAQTAKATLEQGIVSTSFGHPPPPTVPPAEPALPWMDPWAERYGGD